MGQGDIFLAITAYHNVGPTAGLPPGAVGQTIGAQPVCGKGPFRLASEKEHARQGMHDDPDRHCSIGPVGRKAIAPKRNKNCDPRASLLAASPRFEGATFHAGVFLLFRCPSSVVSKSPTLMESLPPYGPDRRILYRSFWRSAHGGRAPIASPSAAPITGPRNTGSRC